MKVGLIGCGGIAPAHIKVYKNLKNLELAAVCDLDANRAKKMATKFNIEKTYTNYWDMFEKEHLDFVDICTPISTHKKIVCDAAEAVPAIFVEKPMALSVAECQEMIKQVDKHGRKLCIGHSQIFSPNIQKVKSMIDSHELDLVNFRTTLKASYEYLRAHNMASPLNISPDQKGIVWEVCTHHAYLQLYFLPDIEEVYAMGSKVKYQVYDDFSVLLRTPRKSFGAIEISWLPHETEVSYEFRDSAGRSIQILWEYGYMFEKSQSPPFTPGLVAQNMLTDDKRLLNKWAKFSGSYFHKNKLLPISNLVTLFVESVQKNLPAPVTPEDGLRTVRLLECIEQSLDEKRPVPINL